MHEIRVSFKRSFRRNDPTILCRSEAGFVSFWGPAEFVDFVAEVGDNSPGAIFGVPPVTLGVGRIDEFEWGVFSVAPEGELGVVGEDVGNGGSLAVGMGDVEVEGVGLVGFAGFCGYLDLVPSAFGDGPIELEVLGLLGGGMPDPAFVVVSE